ncbi:macrophage-expressed protein 1-like [Arapaima gigas]
MMALYVALLCVLLPFWVSSISITSSSSFHECRKLYNLPVLEVLPGGGWDNLRNMDAGQVMKIEYSQCQTTKDGIYLLPDQVFTVPIKSSKVQINSEILDSWLSFTSTTASSVNLEAKGFSILNGKFSEENQRIKQYQAKENSVTSRTEVRNRIYAVKARPGFALDASFLSVVTDIANALENNNTQKARFLSETLVLDYGTHVLTSVEAGAGLVLEDYLASSYVRVTEKKKITESASASFFHMVNTGMKGSSENLDIQKYIANTVYSVMESHGSVPFYPNITLKTWQDGIHNNLVAVDRFGLPLYFFINHRTLPDLPEPTVSKVSQAVSQAIEHYYTFNTHPGCTDPSSANYNYQANVDDQSCKFITLNLNFGGVFQECIPAPYNILGQEYPDSKAQEKCQSLTQKNPATGALQCQAPYQAILLRSEKFIWATSNRQCREECDEILLIFSSCQIKCGDVYSTHQVTVNTYWCAPNHVSKGDHQGYLFGGFYSPSVVNPLTRSKRCPDTFIPLTFLSDGLKVCLSNDFELGTRFSVPFGGFFSCEAGNPLANGTFHCPDNFTQHMVDVSDGCEILFCTRSGAFSHMELTPIRLPPFTRQKALTVNTTSTMIVVSQNGTSWVRNGQSWKRVNLVEARRTFQKISGLGSPGPRGTLIMALMTTSLLMIP